MSLPVEMSNQARLLPMVPQMPFQKLQNVTISEGPRERVFDRQQIELVGRQVLMGARALSQMGKP